MRFLMSVLLLLTTAAAWAAPANVLSWDATTKTLTITETATGAIASTDWPLTIGAETINKTDVEHLVIGNGMTKIMSGTFENCTNLVTATISNSVTSIGGAAFKNCTSLTTISLPNNVDFTIIEPRTFAYCTSLTSITIPNSVTTIDQWAFYGSGLTSFPTANGVMTIEQMAFRACLGLTSVTIPPSVMNIGEFAFRDCDNLTTVKIYNMEASTETEPGVYSESGIHPDAFGKNVHRIIIPSVVTSITESNLSIFRRVRDNKAMVDICYEGPKSGCDQLFGKTYQINWEENHQEPLDKFGLTQASVHWLCTATFDMQGVLPNPAPQTVYSYMDEVQCEQAPTAQGYDFGGWYRDKNCTLPFAKTVESVTTYGRTIPCDATIYAKWTARTDNVITFDTDGKGTTPASQTLTTGQTVTVPDGQTINEGGVDYVIGGWYTDAGCNDLYDFSTKVNHTMTLYAKWVEATGHANITVNDGGSVTLTDAIGQTYRSTSPIVPGLYTLTVTPESGNSFVAEYTLTLHGGSSESLQTLKGNATISRQIDLTTKDVDITVTFSTNPVVSVMVSTDGTAEAGTYFMQDGHSKTYVDGDDVTAYGDASQPADAITLTINKDAGVGCALTIVNNGQKSQRTTDTSNYGFTPHGNVTIELFFYDTTSGMIELANDADNSTALTTANGKKRMVTLSGRTLKRDGNWNTLCLPFDFDITGSVLDKTGMTLKELDTETADNGHLTGLEGSTLYLNFKSAGTQIKAGKPYIIKWTKPSSYSSSKDITDPVFGAVTIDNSSPESVTSADGNVTFAGQYSPFSIVESGATGDNQGNINEILLLAAGNKLGYSQNPRTLHSFRCHFYVPTNGTTAARSFVVDFGEGETTEIETITNNQYPETITNNQYPETITNNQYPITDGAWYTIDGRKLTGKPTAKGIYIVNGKKVIVK